MYFVLGVIFNFALGFGAVSWYVHQQEPRAPVDTVEMLNSEPAEYRRVHQALIESGIDEADEFGRVLVSYDAHRDRNVLRQEVGGLAHRAVDNRQEVLSRAGLSRLETITRETVNLIERYSTYGEAFCTYSIRREFTSADRILAENRRQQETAQLIEEFKQARFEIAVLGLEALADGMKNQGNRQEIHHVDLQDILVASASAENRETIRRLKAGDWSCQETIIVLETALAIEDDDDRRTALAQLRSSI